MQPPDPFTGTRVDVANGKTHELRQQTLEPWDIFDGLAADAPCSNYSLHDWTQICEGWTRVGLV
jgi:hypothetical protein